MRLTIAFIAIGLITIANVSGQTIIHLERSTSSYDLEVSWDPSDDYSLDSGYFSLYTGIHVDDLIVLSDSIFSYSFYLDSLVLKTGSNYFELRFIDQEFQETVITDTTFYFFPAPDGLFQNYEIAGSYWISWNDVEEIGDNSYLLSWSESWPILINLDSSNIVETYESGVDLYLEEDGSSYYLQVGVVDENGFRHFESDSIVIHTQDFTPPDTPQKLHTKDLGDGTILLEWEPVSYVGDFYTYYIFVDTDLSFADTSQEVIDTTFINEGDAGLIGFNYPSDSTQIFDLYNTSKSIKAEGYYNHYISIAAVDTSGNISEFTEEIIVEVTDKVAPESPLNLLVSNTNTTLHISWNDIDRPGDFSSFKVYVSQDDVIVSEQLMSTTSTDISGLSLNEYYDISVVSIDSFSNESTNPEIINYLLLDSESEPNETAALANFFTSGISGFNSIGDVDMFQMRSGSGIGYDVLLMPDRIAGEGLSNVELALLTLDSTEANFEYVYYPGATYAIRFFSEIPADYYLELRRNASSNSGYYKIIINEVYADSYENNDAVIDASELTSGTSIDDLSIFGEGDEDYFVYSASSGEIMNFSVQSSEVNLSVKVLNENNELIKEVDESIEGESFYTVSEYTGEHYFVVTSSIDDAGGTGSYELDFGTTTLSSKADRVLFSEVNPDYLNDGKRGFIELYNHSTNTINLNNWRVHGAVEFAFNNSFELESGSRIVIATSNEDYFDYYNEEPYARWISSEFKINSDELILMDENGALVNYVKLFSGESWPSIYEEVFYHTLELKEGASTNKTGENWQASLVQGGTPGVVNSSPSYYVQDGYELNQDIGSAKLLAVGDYDLTVTAKQESAVLDESDFFKLKYLAGDSMLIELNYDQSQVELTFVLLNSDSTILAQSMETSEGKSIKYLVEKSADYFIGIVATAGEAFYHLEVRAQYSPIVTPYLETFETGTNSWLGYHWDVINGDENYNQWRITNGEGKNGSNCVSVGFNDDGNDDWLILPALSLGKRDFLTFETRVDFVPYESFEESFEIWIGDKDAIYREDFHTRLDSVTIDNIYYRSLKWDLLQFAHQDIKIAIRNISVAEHTHYIDQVAVGPQPPVGVIKGVVSDLNTMGAIDSALINIPSRQINGYTQPDGSYILSDVPIGTHTVSIGKRGYQNSEYEVSLVEDDTITISSKLKAVRNSMLAYHTGFETGEDQGVVDSSLFVGWQTAYDFGFDEERIFPVDNYMLTYGGESGYINSGTINYWSSSPFDLVDFLDARLSFRINRDIRDSEDKLFILAQGKYFQSVILDLNEDGQGDNDDFISGISEGWDSLSYDLSAFTGLEFGKDVIFSFAMLTNELDSGGFGVVIDQVSVTGTQIEPVYPLHNLVAKSFQAGQVELKWEQSQMDGSKYKVFRKFEDDHEYAVVTQTTDTFFVDTQISDYKTYDYYVVVSTEHGESPASNIVSALPGTPIFHTIKYDINSPQRYFEDFEDVEGSHIPDEWAEQYSDKGYFEWVTADSVAANLDGNILYPGHGRFAYVNEQLESSNLVHEGNVILESPWFDISDVTTNLVMKYTTFSHVESQHHYVAYRTEIKEEWTVFDSIETNQEWETIIEDLSPLVGKEHLQIGFWFDNPEANFETLNGWAIDDFSIEELPFGYVSGLVKNIANEPIANAKIKILETGDILYADASGKYEIIDVFHGTTLSLVASGWYHEDSKKEQITIVANTTMNQDILIDAHLDVPANLSLSYTEESFAKLEWDAVENRDHLLLGGASFSGTYNLYKGTLPEVLTLYKADLANTNFVDTVSVGQSVYYRVSANYSVGKSNTSNRVMYNLRTLAFMKLDDQPVEVIIPFGQVEYTAPFNISNIGKQTLSYDIEFKQFGVGVYPILEQELFGEVAPGSGQIVEIPIEISEFISGNYQGQLIIHTNDPNTPIVTKTIEIELDKARNDLSGTIVNDQTGEPIIADVAIVGVDTLRDQSGIYVFEDIAVGSYLLKVTAAGYFDYTANLSMTGNAQVIPWNVKMDPILESPDSVFGQDHESFITISWTKPSGINSDNITGFTLYKKVNDEVAKMYQSLDKEVLTFDDYEVSPDFSYTYYLVTKYSLGTSDPSSPLDIQITDLQPVISGYRDVVISEDSSGEYLLEAFDPNGNDVNLTFQTTHGLIDLDYDGVRILSITGKENENGVDTVRISAFDGHLTTSAYFTVQITEEPDAPYFLNTPELAVNRNATYTFDFEAVDPDGDQLEYEAIAAPAWLVIDTVNHTMSGIPKTEDIGSHQIILSSSDGTLSAQLEFILEVTSVNNAPVFNMVSNLEFNEMDEVIIPITFSDPDEDVVQVISTVLPDWMSYSDVDNTIVGIPGNGQVGFWSFDVSIADDFDTTDYSGSFEVIDINQSPIITSVPSGQATVGAQYQYQVRVNEPDGDKFEITADTIPDWLVMTNSGLISGTPSSTDASQTFKVVIRVIDEFEAVGIQSFELSVKRTNSQPYFTSQPDVVTKSAMVGQLYEYVLTAYDEDGDDIIYSISEGPEWLTIAESEFYTTISGTPPSEAIGSHVVAISITDGLSNPVQQVYLLQVDQILGTSDAKSLLLYPVPARDFLYFDPPDERDVDKSMTIYDLSGQVIYTNSSLNEMIRIDLSGWKSGVYLVRYQSSSQFINQKIQVK